jgi:hypothetical protein
MTGPIRPADIERIAQVLLRDYALPLKIRGVTLEEAGRCTIGFADRYSGEATVVGIWCDGKVSPHSVRESLKRGLEIVD